MSNLPSDVANDFAGNLFCLALDEFDFAVVENYVGQFKQRGFRIVNHSLVGVDQQPPEPWPRVRLVPIPHARRAEREPLPSAIRDRSGSHAGPDVSGGRLLSLRFIPTVSDSGQSFQKSVSAER